MYDSPAALLLTLSNVILNFQSIRLRIVLILASGSDLGKANSCTHNMIGQVTPHRLFLCYALIRFL
jgi:hypothetical protein